MKKETVSSLRKALLLLATTAAALGVFLGLPVKKTMAASRDWKMAPAPTVNQPSARLEVIQPRYVNPTAVTLLRITEQALSNNALAERISRDPDGVAAQFRLSRSRARMPPSWWERVCPMRERCACRPVRPIPA